MGWEAGNAKRSWRSGVKMNRQSACGQAGSFTTASLPSHILRWGWRASFPSLSHVLFEISGWTYSFEISSCGVFGVTLLRHCLLCGHWCPVCEKEDSLCPEILRYEWWLWSLSKALIYRYLTNMSPCCQPVSVLLFSCLRTIDLCLKSYQLFERML